MPLSESSVAAASAAWVWVPDGATVVEDAGYCIARFPDYFDHQLEVTAFRPEGPLGEAVDAVLERARAFGLPTMQWQVRLDDPPGLAAELEARGGKLKLALDVLASDLTGGAAALPALPPPSVYVVVRWATDVETQRDGSAVGVATFGGALPPEERLQENADRDAATMPDGQGGMVVAYADGEPAGSGGVIIVGGVARLWGGAVVPSARGRGIYLAVLAERLSYAVSHGATMALVKGRADTSGPILRRAGFEAFGQEPIYDVPL
ncbi:MAG TPA: GNAT family N-acetyltransferase [Trebonia sp.]|nr:GNAT family N-acetyltransferase [Trebonia sp.]